MNDAYLISSEKDFPKILGKEEFEARSLDERGEYSKAVIASIGFKNNGYENRFRPLNAQLKEFLGMILNADTLEGRWRYRYFDDESVGKKVPSLLSYTADWFDICDIAKEMFPKEYGELITVTPSEPEPIPPKAEEVIGFQICPFYRDVKGYVNQCGGADGKTEGYNVYKRLSDTSLVWHDEWSTEAEAVTCAETLSRYTGLPILRYDWQNPQAPTLAESTVAFENFAKEHPKLKSIGFSTSENAYVYAPTQTAKEVWDAACSWMRQVFAARQ
jgi:hypothetical protein